MTEIDPFRSPMSTARGHGAAKEGVHHWWWQRVTALALIPLGIWFVISLLCMMLHRRLPDYFDLWLLDEATPSLLLLLLLGAMFWHGKLGIQVIIEDYVHCGYGKKLLLILNIFVFTVAGLASTLAILKLHFGL